MEEEQYDSLRTFFPLLRSGNAFFLGSGLTREGICMSVKLIMMAELYSALMGPYAVAVNAEGQVQIVQE